MPRDTALELASLQTSDTTAPLLDGVKLFVGSLAAALLAGFLISTMTALPGIPSDMLVRTLELANG